MLTVANDLGSVSISPQALDVSSNGGDMKSIISWSGMAIKASQQGSSGDKADAQLVTLIQRTGVFSKMKADREPVELSWSDSVVPVR